MASAYVAIPTSVRDNNAFHADSPPSHIGRRLLASILLVLGVLFLAVGTPRIRNPATDLTALPTNTTLPTSAEKESIECLVEPVWSPVCCHISDTFKTFPNPCFCTHASGSLFASAPCPVRLEFPECTCPHDPSPHQLVCCDMADGNIRPTASDCECACKGGTVFARGKDCADAYVPDALCASCPADLEPVCCVSSDGALVTEVNECTCACNGVVGAPKPCWKALY